MGVVSKVTTGFLRRKNMLSQKKLLRDGVWAMLIITGSVCLAQKDPGVRPGPPGAGAPLNGLTPIELSMFNEGLQRAIQLQAVCDDCSDLTLGALLHPAHPNF